MGTRRTPRPYAWPRAFTRGAPFPDRKAGRPARLPVRLSVHEKNIISDTKTPPGARRGFASCYSVFGMIWQVGRKRLYAVNYIVRAVPVFF